MFCICAQLLCRCAAVPKFLGTLRIIREQLNALCFFRALRLGFLCCLQCLLCRMERRLCRSQTQGGVLQLPCSRLLLLRCLHGCVLLVDDGLRTLRAFQKYAKICD